MQRFYRDNDKNLFMNSMDSLFTITFIIINTKPPFLVFGWFNVSIFLITEKQIHLSMQHSQDPDQHHNRIRLTCPILIVYNSNS